jgi:formate-dependent nitrite reductase cytochrome c552 subunit
MDPMTRRALSLPLAACLWAWSGPASGAPKGAACASCHPKTAARTAAGKHAALACSSCHDGLPEHLASSSSRPLTRVGLEACGACHPDQYRTSGTVNLSKPAWREKALQPEKLAAASLIEKLLAGFGELKRKRSPRSHAFMLIDHLAVDRAYGGRFVPKKGLSHITATRGPLKAWDVLKDSRPEDGGQKALRPGTSTAATPNCLQCKTQDHILDWNFLGEKDGRARWDKSSNVVEIARSVQNGMNCFFCHDPHGAGPRVVSDGLIAALERPERDTLWHKDPKATRVDIVVPERSARKIGLLAGYDTKLQCGQCHVENDCHPDTASEDGCADDAMRLYPLKSPLDLLEKSPAPRFTHFRHRLTGTVLRHSQHPEVEVYWGSAHDRAGVDCKDCHMPRVKNPKGDAFTSHWQTSPRHYLRETCLLCHKEWDEAEAAYVIDSVQSYVGGEMTKARTGLSRLIDAIMRGQDARLPAGILESARRQHAAAHLYWRWGESENSRGFHNPGLAADSMARSFEESAKGVRLIEEALPPRRR